MLPTTPQPVPTFTPVPPVSDRSPLIPILITLVVIAILIAIALYAKMISFAPASTDTASTATQTAPVVTESTLPILSEGTYALVGHGPAQSANYSGTITITKRTNATNVYDLVYHITSGQTQTGVGILTDNVLSVSYFEIGNERISDLGVGSYKVLNLVSLRGEWASVQGSTAGIEELTLQPQI